MRGVWEAVYWFSLPALAILALVLLSRKLVTRFPFFFSYIAAGVLIDVARLITLTSRGQGGAYFYVYWISDSLSSILALFATCEVALGQLFPGFQRVRLYRYLFGISGAIILGSAIFTGTNHRTLMRSDLIVSVPLLIRTLHTIDFLRVALLLFFLFLMFLMGRQWGGYSLGMAFGLGVNAAGLLTSFAIWTRYLNDLLGRVLPAIAYDIACIIWLVTFLHRERPAPSPIVASTPEVVEEAKRWQEVLKKSIAGRKLPR